MPFLFKPLTLNHHKCFDKDSLDKQHEVLNSLKEALNKDYDSTGSLLISLAQITGEKEHVSTEIFEKKIHDYAYNLDALFPKKEDKRAFLLFLYSKEKSSLSLQKGTLFSLALMKSFVF